MVPIRTSQRIGRFHAERPRPFVDPRARREARADSLSRSPARATHPPSPRQPTAARVERRRSPTIKSQVHSGLVHGLAESRPRHERSTARAPWRHPSLQVRLRQFRQVERRSHRWPARDLPWSWDTPSSPVRATLAPHSAARPPRRSQNRYRTSRTLRSFSLRDLLKGYLVHHLANRSPIRTRPSDRLDPWARSGAVPSSRAPTRVRLDESGPHLMTLSRTRCDAERVGCEIERIGSDRGAPGLPAMTPTRVGRLLFHRLEKTRQTA